MPGTFCTYWCDPAAALIFGCSYAWSYERRHRIKQVWTPPQGSPPAKSSSTAQARVLQSAEYSDFRVRRRFLGPFLSNGFFQIFLFFFPQEQEKQEIFQTLEI